MKPLGNIILGICFLKLAPDPKDFNLEEGIFKFLLKNKKEPQLSRRNWLIASNWTILSSLPDFDGPLFIQVIGLTAAFPMHLLKNGISCNVVSILP
jgi:hypothetical protein